MSPLRNEEKRALLDIARKSISLSLTEKGELRVSSPQGNLGSTSGVFVTLHRRGRLRGCMGRMEPVEPLADVVAQCAAVAANEDPRFSPLQAEEMNELEIEISVLSALQTVRPEEVEPGRHGLMISKGLRKGVLLPQVATEHRWSRERFLEETCRKGGLQPNAWKDAETKIDVFTAEVFSESDVRVAENENAAEDQLSSDHSTSQ